MKYLIILVLVILKFSDTYSQYASGKFIPDPEIKLTKDFNDWSYKISSTITIKDLKEHLYTLASDDFEGRETGSVGNTSAANYIADEFKKLGLPTIGKNDNYFQSVAFTFSAWEKLVLNINDIKYKLLQDFIAFPQHSISADIASENIVFLGYGIDDDSYSDYNDADVTNKVLIVFDGEPISESGHSLVTKNEHLSKWSENWKLKSQAAKRHGAKMLIIVSNNLQELVNSNRRQLVNRVTQLGDYVENNSHLLNTLFLSSKIAETILGDKKETIISLRNKLAQDGQTKINVRIPGRVHSTFEVNRNVISGQNVMGFIEGTDKKDEIVILSAHYDHIGKKGNEIYNGADDNASGTTAVLEIAEALATSKRMGHGPNRSILCLLVTGEEKGLLGSEYYASNPKFPIENTIADVNVDMVGRWGNEYKDKKDDYIYVIGSDRLSLDLHNINEEMNQKYTNLLLDYKYNDENDPNRFYYRSDHYNFAKHGIPSIFFFNGVHEDYHRLSDTVEKIDFTTMQMRARHIFHVVWELANRKDRIGLNEVSSPSP